MKNKLFIWIMIISCIAALFAGYDRYKVENGYKNIEITGDLDALSDLADYGNMNVKNILKDYKNKGMNSISVNEVNLKKLQDKGKASYMSLSDASAMGMTSDNAALKDVLKKADGFLPNSVVVITEDKDTAGFLSEGLAKRYKDVIYDASGGLSVFAFNKPLQEVEINGLGFDTADFDMVKSAGLIPVARIENYNNLNDSGIDDYMDMIQKYNIDQVVFGRDEVLGNEDKIDYAAERFKEEGITTGIIELPVDRNYETQEGMNMFAKQTDYKAFKLFSLSGREMAAYDKTEIADKWYRAVLDRNVRMVYVRPEIRTDKTAAFNVRFYGGTIDLFKGYMNDIGEDLGEIVPMSELHTPWILQAIIGLGVVAGSIMLLNTLVSLTGKAAYSLMALGAVITFGTLYSKFFDLGIKALALVSSVVFPALAIAYVMKVCEEKRGSFISYTLKNFLKASLISAAGALYIAAIMADSKYLLKLDYFRGVKLSFIGPLLYFLILYFVRYFRQDLSIKDRVVYVLKLNVKIWYVVVLAIAFVVVFVYLSRTGNNPAMGVSSVELKLRSILEHVLVARPREKEFLIGYPALILMLSFVYYGFRKGWRLVWGLFASIGQLSLVNTFSHLRAPLGISILRTVYGIILGIAVGFIYFAIFKYFLGLIKKKWGVDA
jgi:hypothetical protein